jgi:hypothetical protein
MKNTNKIAKGTKTIVAKNFILPMISSFVSQFPEFMPHWILVQGFFGSLFDLQQEKINEFVEFIKNNKEIFTKEIIITQDFKDGFLITFQEYIKQRNKEKRKYIQNIFLGFATADDKINFELERMCDLLNKLSSFQFYILKKFNSNKKIKISNEDRNEAESDYDDIRYLQSLGLLNISIEQKIETDITTEKRVINHEKHSGEEYLSDANSYLDENETFYLSAFGEDFIDFIIDQQK